MSRAPSATPRATALVAEREVREALRRRSFWIVLAVLFVGACAAVVLPDALDSGPARYDVAVVAPAAPAAEFGDTLTPIVRSLDASVRYRTADDVAEARALVVDDSVDVAVVLGGTTRVLVRAGEHEPLVGAVRQALATRALATDLDDAGLGPAAIADVLGAAPAPVEELAVDDSERRTAASVLSVVLYLVILMLMIQAATGVAIEKANRISEVLLAVVKPGALLFGKIIGVGLVGVVSLAVAAIPIVVTAALGGNLPTGLGPAVAGGAPWFVLGIALYLTIAGSLGALVERQEEAGSVLAPLSLLLVATYIIAQTFASTPELAGSTAATILAIFPLTSPIVMPMQIALGEASAGEIVASLAFLVVSLAVAVRLGAALYRRGIVHTGRRLRLREALRSP